MILAVALVVVGAAYTVLWLDTKDLVAAAEQNGVSNAAGQGADTPQAPAAEPDLSTAPYMTIGADDAPVTIYEWTDFTCPYCGLFHRDTLPAIISEYVDSGQVRIEVHDVTFIGEQAEDAAVAARAAGQQDRYFDYLFAIYELGADGGKPNLDEAQLSALADELGLDSATFAEDFASAELRSTVQASTAQAQAMGISGVPFFLVANTGTLAGAQQLNGAQPFDTFTQVIDAQLAKG